MKRRAYVIAWSNPQTGLDEFYAGDEGSAWDWKFDGLGAAVLFPDETLAERALELLMFDVPVAIYARLGVRPVTVSYHGKAKP